MHLKSLIMLTLIPLCLPPLASAQFGRWEDEGPSARAFWQFLQGRKQVTWKPRV